MRWTVTTSSIPDKGLDFCKRWLNKFNYDSLSEIRVSKGKSGYGVYGWCDYNDEKSRPYSIQLFVPGPFPFTVTTKQPSIRLKLYGLNDAIPDNQTIASRNVCSEDETVTVKLETKIVLNNFSEGLIFLFGHELHHYLSSDDHITADDTENNADDYGRFLLSKFKSKTLV